MDSGYIKLWRKLMRSDMYLSLNSVQRDVMIQCLMLANHAPKKWEWNGQIFRCEPGQFITSLDSLRKKCGQGVGTMMVRTSLQKLEKWDFLTNEATKTGRLITIKNWHTYQNSYDTANKEDNKELTKLQQSSNKELTTTKNEKNYKNEKNEKKTTIGDGFEKFWIAYPNKKSKGYAEKAWLKINPSEQLLETIISKIEQAKTSEQWTKDNGRFIPHPSTWLNARGWEDEYIAAVPPKTRMDKTIEVLQNFIKNEEKDETDDFFALSDRIR